MKKSVVVLSCCLLILSCSQKKAKSYELRVKGSESLYDTFVALKSGFEKNQDSIKLLIEGGGSRTGLAAIRSGKADIGLSSYRFPLDTLFGINHGVNEIIVAYDGIVVVNNKRNPMMQLNNKQIQQIFEGKISNWSEIGGKDGVITRIIRDKNSGTQKFFQEYFDISEMAKSSIVEKDNKHIVERVFNNENAIGFISFSYFAEQINSVQLQNKHSLVSALTFVDPAFKTLENGAYPLRRSLQLYYSDGHEGLNPFLDYLKSKEAKSILEMHGMLSASY
jgi:phosphate transport system substrate-binding protein